MLVIKILVTKNPPIDLSLWMRKDGSKFMDEEG